MLFFASALSSLVFFSNKVIADFSVLDNNSITRVAGEYYFVFQIYMVFFIFLSTFFLIKNILNAKEYYIKSRCLITLLAFLPFMLVAVLLMLLMQLGYRVNMAGFLSLATCFMLLVFLSLNNKYSLFKVMKFVPFSRERVYYLKLSALLAQLSRPWMEESVDMKSLLKEIEILVIQNAHHYFATQKEVAQALSISESNLSRKLDSK
ncbi:hypothetical protein [Marinomonas transparens]|uniref:hypothetical protein n=1 Tax=Marinomonas transparens TaxID=2795388 RepID=UPI001F2F80B8|nr:hypothetical protein [Marinomonas transparens]